MRIWLLSSELAHEVAGGIARYVDNFARLLAAAGHETLVVGMARKALDTQPAEGYRVIGLEPHGGSTHGGEPPVDVRARETLPAVFPFEASVSHQLARTVMDLLEELPAPDIIESQDYSGLPYFLLQRKLTQRSALDAIPVLVHIHSPLFELMRANQEPRYAFPRYWIGHMERFCIHAADALLCPSRFCAEDLKGKIGIASEIETIPLPMPIPAQNPCGLTPQRGNILYVGRLQVCKGVLPLLKACSRLWSAGHDFRLTLVGGDCSYTPMNTTVGSYIQKRYDRWFQSGRIRWLGQVEHSSVLEEMRQAWAVVIPSLWENFPNTCLEAMALGQVVLGSISGGQAEILGEGGINGFLFDWGKDGDFEDKLLNVLALPSSARLEIGSNARRRIDELCDPASILERRLHHYGRVIEGCTPRGRFPRTAGPFQPMPSGGPGGLSPEPRGTDGLLSVVMPCGDMTGRFDESLKAVLASGHRPLELIFVTGGGRESVHIEGALKLAEEAGIRHVEVIPRDGTDFPLGVMSCADLGKGDFLTFVDSEHLVEPVFFERSVDVLRRYADVAFVYSWVRCIDGGDGIWPSWNAELPYLLTCRLPPVLPVARRSALKDLKSRTNLDQSGDDYESWLYLVEAGGHGVSLPDALVRFRVGRDFDSLSPSLQQRLLEIDSITQRHAPLYRRWGAELFNFQLANGPEHLWNHPACPQNFTRVPVGPEEPSGVTEEFPWHYRLVGDAIGILRRLKPLQVMLGNPARKERFKAFLGRVAGVDRPREREAHSAVSLAQWQSAFDNEVAFWRDYLQRKGADWPQCYQHQIDPESWLNETHQRLVQHIQDDPIHILDVGSGPMTMVGKRHPSKRLVITATDVLADEYAALLNELGLKAPVPTVYADMTRLEDQFPPESFHLITATNCVDHCQDPLLAIEQMLRILKPGCYLCMNHSRNEGMKQQYSGFHQWDFDREKDRFVIRSRGGGTNDVAERLGPVAQVACEVDADDWIWVYIRKNPRD